MSPYNVQSAPNRFTLEQLTEWQRSQSRQSLLNGQGMSCQLAHHSPHDLSHLDEPDKT